jgi:hypothetical protein
MGFLSPHASGLLITLLPLLSSATAADQITSATLPLTTIFTPPPNCFTDVSLFTGYNYPTASNSPYSVGLGAGNEFSDCSPCWLGLATTSTCFPSSYSISATYSPGVCPEGYEIACSSVDSNGQALETVATCCPRYVFSIPPNSDPTSPSSPEKKKARPIPLKSMQLLNLLTYPAVMPVPPPTASTSSHGTPPNHAATTRTPHSASSPYQSLPQRQSQPYSLQLWLRALQS